MPALHTVFQMLRLQGIPPPSQKKKKNKNGWHRETHSFMEAEWALRWALKMENHNLF